MRIEQIQELSQLTEIAVFNYDVDQLKLIRAIIEKDFQDSEYINEEGDEWFYSMVPDDLLTLIE
jgi:hypothetical protein